VSKTAGTEHNSNTVACLAIMWIMRLWDRNIAPERGTNKISKTRQYSIIRIFLDDREVRGLSSNLGRAQCATFETGDMVGSEKVSCYVIAG
jgi:hypothetical protein